MEHGEKMITGTVTGPRTDLGAEWVDAVDDDNIHWPVKLGNIDKIEAEMGSNRREAPEENKMERKPCPKCGKMSTWLADGSRPREHKCVPKPGGVNPELVEAEIQGILESLPPVHEAPKVEEPSELTAKVILAYIKTRDEIAAKKKEFEEAIAPLKGFQEAREKYLAGELEKAGLTSMKKNGIGTAFFKTRSSATLADASQFTDWVMADWEHRNHFLERRVSKTAVDEFVEEGHELPPGTNYTTVRVVQVNRG